MRCLALAWPLPMAAISLKPPVAPMAVPAMARQGSARPKAFAQTNPMLESKLDNIETSTCHSILLRNAFFPTKVIIRLFLTFCLFTCTSAIMLCFLLYYDGLVSFVAGT